MQKLSDIDNPLRIGREPGKTFSRGLKIAELIIDEYRHHRQCIRILRRKQYTLGLTYFERQRLRQLMQ